VRTPNKLVLIIISIVIFALLKSGYITIDLLGNRLVTTEIIEQQQPSPTPTPTPEEIKQEIFTLVNAERTKKGLAPLRENPLLDKSAELKAEDLIQKDYWAHNSPEGLEPWNFFQRVGYGYSYAGENLAKNFYNPQDIINSWMNSEEHRKDILNGVYEETGIAVVYPTVTNVLFTSGTLLIVQHFGTKIKPYIGSGNLVNNNQTSSRTGRIISYHDWCNNKDVSVYENEIIVKKSSDGNVYGMTSDDWVCYENALKNRK